jgi:hypothetical protein
MVEVAVECGTLLISMDGAFCGIYIDDESPFVSAPKQGLGRPAEAVFKSFETSRHRQDVVLEPAEC